VLRDYGLDLLEFCNIHPFSEGDDAEANILEIARDLEEQQNPKQVRYATFHTFPRTM